MLANKDKGTSVGFTQVPTYIEMEKKFCNFCGYMYPNHGENCILIKKQKLNPKAMKPVNLLKPEAPIKNRGR